MKLLHVVLLSLAVALARSASAAPSEADKLIDRGVDLREEGKDKEALELFQRAYELGKSPRATAQIGLAQQALGRWVEAEASLEKAIAESKHPWIKTRKAALESALVKVRERIGQLEILGTAGAGVSIDGRPVGTLPLERAVHVVAGSITVEVSGEGYLPVTRTVNVPAGGLARESIELVKRPADPPKVAVQDPPTVQKTSADQPAKVTVAPRSDDGIALSTIGFVTGGAALAAAGVGTAFIFVRNSHISKYNDDVVCLAGGLTRDQNCGAELESADSAGTIMTISYIAAGALAGATALLFVLDDSDDSAVALRCMPGGAGVLCAGSF